ncbi:hypothetical protein ALC57_02253 [Trachymyrmex cornetzi]|uniref:Uncharacterized protein n=1 Tax=Trachymyrmex cornetzi TaxID=471704 RepID=A0A151JP63_9HYME|nr:hypothetical protein ALC57_02253 [Trachymyrmex cornetzi]
MPRKRALRKSNPWWTDELTKLKKEVSRKRKIIQGSNRPKSQSQRTEEEAGRISALRQEYQESLRHYNRAIRRTKYESWKNFVTECGNEKPWGFVYKQQANKLRTEKVISTLRRGANFTKTAKETAQWLLDTHVPEDLSHEDTQNQGEARKPGKNSARNARFPILYEDGIGYSDQNVQQWQSTRHGLSRSQSFKNIGKRNP